MGRPSEKANRTWRLIKRDKTKLLMLLPTIILLLLFSYLPFYGVLIAFQDYSVGKSILAFDGSVSWVGMKHFTDFFGSIFFKRLFFNIFRLSVLCLLYGFWVPIVFALLLNEIRAKWFKRMAQTFTYLPYFISVVIVVAMLQNLFSSEGTLTRLFGLFGMPPVNMMRTPKYFDALYVGSHIWQSFGYSSIIYLAGIAGADPTLYEAATMDGANRFHKIIHITLPAIAPTIAVLLILSVGGILASNTEKIILMSNSAIAPRAEVIGSYIYTIGLRDGRYSYTTAIGLFTNIVNFVLVFGANMFARKYAGYSLW